MFTYPWLATPMCRLLTLALLHFVWQGIVIGLVLVLFVEVRGVRRSAWRYGCSLAALVAMAVAPWVTLVILALGSAAESNIGERSLRLEPALAGTPWVMEVGTLQPYLLTAWLAGIAVFGSRLVVGAVGVARLRRAALPLAAPVAKVVVQLGLRLKIDALPRVMLSEKIAEAMAVGVFRPLVLIPTAWVAEMPLELLEAVIAHELAHLRRHDLWVNLLQRVVETLLFYHPAVWWLSRRLRIERELCADELAVAATGKPLAYAQALEQIAAERQAEIRPALAAFMRGDANMRLLQRIQNVLGQPPRESSRVWPVGIAAVVLPLLLWAAAALGGRAMAEDEREQAKKPAIKRDRGEGSDEKRVKFRIAETENADPKEVQYNGKRLLLLLEKEEDEDGDEAKEKEKRAKAEERGGSSERRVDELTAMVKKLAQQMDRLQDEMAQLRGQKAAAKDKEEGEEAKNLRKLYLDRLGLPPTPEEFRKLLEKPNADEGRSNKRAADERNELDARKREIAEAMEKIEAAKKALAEKERALAQMAKERTSEAYERAIKEWAEKDAADKKRAVEEKIRAAREKGAAAEREKDADGREEKERALKELERAKQRKEEAARDKKEAERKELEEKLKKLKEGKESAALEHIDSAEAQARMRGKLIGEQALVK